MTNRTIARLDYRELAAEALDGGFTIALDGTRPTTGYVVALPGHERRFKLLPAQDSDNHRAWNIQGLADMLYVYVVDHGTALRGRNAHLGAWRDGDTIVLDVSQVEPSERLAVTLGRLRGQDAIYHLDTGETITLRQGVVKPEQRSPAADADAHADLVRELANDEARIADEMEWEAVRGITPPDY